MSAGCPSRHRHAVTRLRLRQLSRGYWVQVRRLSRKDTAAA